MPQLNLLPVVDQVNSPNAGKLSQPREGVMIHFDDSADDRSAVQWFRDPECGVSYNRLYLDNGDVVEVVKPELRAYHAGVSKLDSLCRTTLVLQGITFGSGNSAFYGLSAATNATVPATQKQFEAMCEDVLRIFRFHGWSADSVDHRIVGHEQYAVYNPRDNPGQRHLWGQLGRKIDPTGYHADHPIVSLAGMRSVVQKALQTTPAG